MAEIISDPAAFRAFEAEGWNAGRAEPYERVFGPLTARTADALLDLARAGAGSRVLDVATGPGHVAARAAERGARAAGVDIAPEMVERARGMHPEVEFQVAAAESLPFPDHSFDAVVSSLLLPHLADVPPVVEELIRVLVPGGRLALMTWDLPERSRIMGVALDALKASNARTPPDLPAGPSFFQYSGELAQLLSGAGLTDVATQTIAFSHTIRDADALWTDFVGGTVRTSALIEAQDATTREAIRVTFHRLMQDYRDGDVYRLPVSFKLGGGSRPHA